MQHKILTCDYGHKYVSYTLCNSFPPSPKINICH